MALQGTKRLLATLIWLVASTGAESGPGSTSMSPMDVLSVGQKALVESALQRFDAQGLTMPEVTFVFHDDLMPCHGHLGLHRPGPVPVIEMCSLDERTMLHELAHVWAQANLSDDTKDDFVAWRGLDSWNDHQSDWARRGTEHIAESMAWALIDQPFDVKWVEILDDGSRQVTRRILTLGVTVEVLYENFVWITGEAPVFRDLAEAQGCCQSRLGSTGPR